MTDGRSIVELAVVVAVALGFVTLLVVLQARAHGRTRREIVSTCALIWVAVGLMLAAGWMLDVRTGGGLFDIETASGARLVWRSLSSLDTLTEGALVAAMVALFVVAIVSVRRLLSSPDGLSVTAAPDDEGADD